MASAAKMPRRLPSPILIGGTGRSGTTALAHLLGHHPVVGEVPFEARFHTDADGLPGLWEDHESMTRFVSTMWSRWFVQLHNPPEPSQGGLDRIMSRGELREALFRLTEEFGANPICASRLFTRTVLDRVASAEGKLTWVEASPRNVLFAPQLLQIFPRMRLVVCVRDGRDVAASLARLDWTESFDSGLAWWEDRTRKCSAALEHLPADVAHVLQFEDLTIRKRDQTYSELIDWLALPDSPQMRSAFASEMPVEKANVGRWRRGVSGSERRRRDRLYSEMLERLERDGVSLVPVG